MQKEQRKEIIPELDQLTSRADELRKELSYLLDRYQLYNEKTIQFTPALTKASELVAFLRRANDALKQANASSIQAYVTDWYRFRVDEESSIPDPDFESISYDGNDTWTIIMTTSTHGRERVIVHSNTATWDQVYSAERV